MTKAKQLHNLNMHKVFASSSKCEKRKNKQKQSTKENKKKKKCATKNGGKDLPPLLHNKIITHVSKSYLGNNDLNFGFVVVRRKRRMDWGLQSIKH